MDEVDRSFPTDGSVSSVGAGAHVSAEAGDSAPTGVSILSYLWEHGLCPHTLVAMSYGCKKEGGAAMLDNNIKPYASMPTKAVKALASNYRNKVIRCYTYAHKENDSVPHSKHWSIVKYQEWLDRHPIDDGGEWYNLVTEIEKHRLVAEKAAAERLSNAEALDGGKKWQGKYPMLRMIHALVDHDEIKRANLTHHDLPSGQISVENRNTPAAIAQNVWHLIANKWNNVLFVPSTNAMDCHSDFFVSEVIGFDTVCNFATATAEKVGGKVGGGGVSSK